MSIVKGIAFGLALFALWCIAIVAVITAVATFQYWGWAVFPAAFIAFGISVMRDRATKARGQ